MNMIDISKHGEVAVLRLTARRLDASNALAFKESVIEIIAQGNRRLVLDLGGVDFIDSSGLGSVVAVLKNLGGKGSLAVCNVKGAVQNLFKLTRMDKVFTIVGSTDDAIARVSG